MGYGKSSDGFQITTMEFGGTMGGGDRCDGFGGGREKSKVTILEG
jgi:hypothetical protein